MDDNNNKIIGRISNLIKIEFVSRIIYYYIIMCIVCKKSDGELVLGKYQLCNELLMPRRR